MKVKFFYLVFTLAILTLCHAKYDPICESKQKCYECIQEFQCVWCIAPNNSSQTPIHCKDVNHITDTNWCPSDKLVNPESSQEILENKTFSSQTEEVIQMQPQRVKIQMRKGEVRNVTFKYRQPENYPVDLYIIMDFSNTMKVHKNKLAQLGKDLAKQMKNITKTFRLGFGSFIDKVVLPYVSTNKDRLKEPCKDCIPAYSFKNHLNLTSNITRFTDQLDDLNKFSGNVDAPEGAFDAVMQAIVCKEIIGWNDNARHIIVLSTDATFHVAGDGKLAGIVQPNDGNCHMENNKYIDDFDYDYPSVSQLNYVAKRNNINIIFAVVQDPNNHITYEMYSKLHKTIEGSKIGALLNNSDNVVDLIRDNYKEIMSTVKMTHNASSNVQIMYSSNCIASTENGCKNVHIGETVEFNATLKIMSCMNHSKEMVILKPAGVNVNLTIELEVICVCDCEQLGNSNFIVNSPECNNMGNLACGVCNCNPERIGSKCECNSTNINIDSSEACNPVNSTNTCSGFGICHCGQCDCKMDHYGKFCECNDYTCERRNGKLCSGSTHGECKCGQCMCNKGWGGHTCECPSSFNDCIDPNNSQGVCSGHGKCSCGECQCTYPYHGRYCQECPTCPGRCEELKQCVECKAFNSKQQNNMECPKNCEEHEIILQKKLNVDNVPDDSKLCIAYDDNNCKFLYQYKYKNYSPIAVQNEKICNKKYARALIYLIPSSLMLAGLIGLAVWKTSTTIHDRREYAKFEKEQKQRRWNTGNPLYKTPITTYNNPLHRSEK